MTDHSEQPELQPTEYNYFLDEDGDVWRQATEDGPHEIMASDSWAVSHPGRSLVLRPLILGEPPLPTEPGLYVVNYREDLPLSRHTLVVRSSDESDPWRYYVHGAPRWTPREGVTLTGLDVVEGEK